MKKSPDNVSQFNVPISNKLKKAFDKYHQDSQVQKRKIFDEAMTAYLKRKGYKL